MARLTISEAARATGVARSTLHRGIKQGRISVDADGLVDTAELLRVGYTLQGVAQQVGATTLQRATPRRATPRQVREPASTQALDALMRERDVLQQQLDATRELLRHERDAGLERERASRERETVLLHLLQQAQAQASRVLDMPRPVVEVGQAPVRSSAQASGMPASWRAILAFMQAQERPVRPQDVQAGLGLADTPRHVMRRMADAGVLVRVSPGVYAVQR